MSAPTMFATLIERFFIERLMQQRHASSHTIASYRDTFRLLFQFAQKTLNKPPSSLDLPDVDATWLGPSSTTSNVDAATAHGPVICA